MSFSNHESPPSTSWISSLPFATVASIRGDEEREREIAPTTWLLSFSCRICNFLRTLANEQGIAVLILNSILQYPKPADMVSVFCGGLELARDTPERLFNGSDGGFKKPFDGCHNILHPDTWSYCRPYFNARPWDIDAMELMSEVCVLNQFHLQYARSLDSM